MDSICLFRFSDGYNSTDIIYHWQSGVTGVAVQHVKLAQFGYKDSRLTEALEPFSTGSIRFQLNLIKYL